MTNDVTLKLANCTGDLVEVDLRSRTKLRTVRQSWLPWFTMKKVDARSDDIVNVFRVVPEDTLCRTTSLNFANETCVLS
ncbi:hypothetical protein PYCC9005_000989 [Savitreella phatthalungensis]